MEYALLVPVLFFCGLYVSKQRLHSMEELVFGLITVVVIVALVLIRKKRLKLRCKGCKKNWVMKLIKTDLISKEDISILAELKKRNSSGEVVGTSEQYIPGTRSKYRSIYECRRCGHQEVRTYKVDKKRI